MRIIMMLVLAGSLLFGGALFAAPEVISGNAGSLVSIHDIQGSGVATPLLGKPVSTSGIVTGISRGGFFIQNPEKDYDRDEKSSEGIFVQAPPASFPNIKIGYLVQVAGLAQEEKSSYGMLTSTVIAGVSAVTSLSQTRVSLPRSIPLTLACLKPKGPVDQLERFEGMRVHMDKATVTGPTIGKKVEETATSQSYGIFFVTLPEVPRPFREAGLDPGLANSYLSNLNGGGTLSSFDGNPELVKIDTGSLVGCVPLDLSTGATVSKITGVLSTAYGTFCVMVDPDCKPAVHGALKAGPVPAKAGNEFSIASFNLERFYDETDDPQVKYDVAIAPEGLERRLAKISLAVAKVLKYPEIISVQEVENLPLLEKIAERLNRDAKSGGAPDPRYQAVLVEGNCPSGLDIGFLVKTSIVKIREVTQVGGDLKIKDQASNQEIPVNLRPPLILKVSLADPSGKPPFEVTLINNHFKSYVKLLDPNYGPFIIKQRQAQAEYLAGLVESVQVKNPKERILLVGDFNAPTDTDGLLDVMGIVRGEPRNNKVLFPGQDLVKRPLYDLAVMVAKEIRYSYVYNGTAQVLDHVLTNKPLVPFVSRMYFARNNADFPDSLRNDTGRPERVSDHDIPVVYFQFQPFSQKFSDLKDRLATLKSSRDRGSNSERRLEADLRNLCREYVDHYVQTGKEKEIRQILEEEGDPNDGDLKRYFEQKTRFRSMQRDN